MCYCQCWARVIFLLTCHASPRNAVLSTRHASPRYFFKIFPASSTYCIMCQNFQLLKLVSTPIRAHPPGGQALPSPPSGHPHPSPPRGHHPPILLVAKLTPLRPAVIFHPSCQCSNSLFPPETGDGRRETGDERRYTRDERQETRDERRETRDEIWETR